MVANWIHSQVPVENEKKKKKKGRRGKHLKLCLIKELVDDWGGYIKNKYIRGKNIFK